MSAGPFRHHGVNRMLALLALATLGCVTNPEGVAKVEVSPSSLTFASIRAPEQMITVTVTDFDGKILRDEPVTFELLRFYGRADRVVSIVPADRAAGTWFVRPFAVPGISHFVAKAGGKSSYSFTAFVASGPPVALSVSPILNFPVYSGVKLPFLISIGMLDADGFFTTGSGPIIASIASGSGTLSGITSINTVSGGVDFDNLVITGTGVFTLRFSSPGLTDVITQPITVTAPATAISR